MANITVPIQVNLPDDWIEQIVNRLRNDPESEWVEIVRCKDCKHYKKEIGWNCTEFMVCSLSSTHKPIRKTDDFCSRAERRTE